jgi:hypothetical protein
MKPVRIDLGREKTPEHPSNGRYAQQIWVLFVGPTGHPVQDVGKPEGTRKKAIQMSQFLSEP